MKTKLLVSLISIMLIASALTSLSYALDVYPEVDNSGYLTIINTTVTNMSHNDLGGLQGGTAAERYHINLSTYNEIVTNVFNWITAAAASPSQWNNTSYPYLYNDTYNIYFNETKLNATIALKVNTSFNQTLTNSLYYFNSNPNKYYNSSNFSINDYANLTYVNSLGNWTANQSFYNTTANVEIAISDANTTMKVYVDNNYYLNNNPNGYFNTSNFTIDNYYLNSNPNGYYNSSNMTNYYLNSNPNGYLNSSYNATYAAKADYNFGANNFNGNGTIFTSGNASFGSNSLGTVLDCYLPSPVVVGTQLSYAFNIRQNGSNIGMGCDETYCYLQSFNSKPMKINNDGNNIILAQTAATRVGIGVTSLINKFEVYGGEPSATSGTLVVNNTTVTVGATSSLGNAIFKVQNRVGSTKLSIDSAGGGPGYFGSGGSSGNFGFGTSTPLASVDIATGGNLLIRANTSAMTCNTTFAGALYYNGGNNKHYECNGTIWKAIYAGDELSISNDGIKTTILGNTGNYTRIGDDGTTAYSLGTNDDLMITGKLEVKGQTYLRGTTYFPDDIAFVFGSGEDMVLRYLAASGSFAMLSKTSDVLITSYNSRFANHDHSIQTNPTLFIHSATDPDTNNTQWLSLTHDQTNGIINTGTGYLRVSSNSSGISIYADNNISATGFITRTSVFNKSKKAFDYIKDASYYKDNGEINHSKFYGEVKGIEVTDYSRPVKEKYIADNCTRVLIDTNIIIKEECNIVLDKIVCNNITNYEPVYENQDCKKIIKERTIYPYKKFEEGVMLDSEVDVLRQAVYELNERVKVLEATCVKK